MKKALAFILCLFVMLIPAFSAFAQEAAQTNSAGITNVLLIISQDKSIPQNGKTYGMGNYIMTVDENNHVLKFISFPYNLAVNIPSGDSSVQKQLMTICQESGPDGVVAVIEDNFGVHIDSWMMITMTGLVNLVDMVGGIEVDLPDLSINKKSGEIGYLVSGKWEDVPEAGLQILNGIQAIAYTANTYYDQPTLEVEEERFRETQKVLITGIFQGFKTLQVDTDTLVGLIFGDFPNQFSTNAPLDSAVTMVRADLTGCLDSDPLFLNIPREIFTVKASNGWQSMGFTDEDIAAVQAFIEQ